MDKFKAYLDWIDNQAQDMRALLIDWCDTNSGSTNIHGVNTFATKVQEKLNSLGTQSKRMELTPFSDINEHGELTQHEVGDALTIQHVAANPKCRVLLSGHLDTVYESTHPFQVTREIDNNTLNGPGVADMKGGLIVMYYALQALMQSPFAEQVSWEVLLTPDEELGSPSSAYLLNEKAPNHDFALIYEPAMSTSGTLASKRKGSGKFAITVHGKAAHSGRSFHEGRNAIIKMGALLRDIHDLNGQREGVTVNIGNIKGGAAVNIVPERCVSHIDVRTQITEDQAWFDKEVVQILAKHQDCDDYQIDWHGHFTRPPKAYTGKTKKLIEAVIDTGQLLQQSIETMPSGGCCDGNNLAACGLPVVDSLGVCGGNIHSENEFILLDSMPQRAKLSALLLMRFAAGELHLGE